MTNKIKIAVILVGLIGVAASTKAQSTATASSEASMIIPISIEKLTDLDFGTFAASAIPGIVEFDGSGYYTLYGGVTISPLSDYGTLATFFVTGEPGATFAYTITSSLTVTGSISGTMLVDNFMTLGIGGGVGVAGFGFNLGGTLHVGANQPAGVYTNASDLQVTVNYN